MELLGNYANKLNSYHYQQLVDLLQQGLVLGDYGGGTLIDKDSISALLLQAQDFTNLPAIRAGNRAYADSINYPLSLLLARYAAIEAESADFVSRIETFLAVLDQDAELVDRLIYQAELEAWVDRQPRISLAKQFYVDFGATHGTIASDVNQTDPLNGALYVGTDGIPKETESISFIRDGVLLHGIGSPVKTREETAANGFRWTLLDPGANPGVTEELSGTDWTSYSLLAPAPRIQFLSVSATVLLPLSKADAQILRVKGTQGSVNIPTYVRIVFTPRRTVKTLTVDQPVVRFTLSDYRVGTDNLLVFNDGNFFEQNQSYTLDFDNGNHDLYTKADMNGQTVNVLFTEYYPGYQCSTNNLDWSPVVLFDPVNPFPDVTQDYFPIDIKDGWFPAVDELGRPTGITFQPVGKPDSEALIRLEMVADPNYGTSAALEVDFSKPGYMNGIRLTPFSGLPMRLRQIDVQGTASATTATIFTGDVAIDRTVSVRFQNPDGSSVYVRKLFLTFYQENYSLVEQVEEASDQLRRDALARLQSTIPFSTAPVDTGSILRTTGAQYDFGLRDIVGERYIPDGPGLLVSGPFSVEGPAEIVRFDAEAIATDAYLMWEAIVAETGEVLTSLAGTPLVSGTAVAVPTLITVPPGDTLLKTSFYVKWALRSETSVVTRFLLQVSTPQ
jgi:hypothetical protein